MTNYIPADQIRAEIEQLRGEYTDIAIDSHYGTVNANHVVDDLEQLFSFLDTLQKSAKRGYKDCNGCEYNRTIKDQIGWQFHGCFGGEYKGKPIAEIELCPLKVAALPEQPVEKTSYDTQKYTPSSSVSVEDVARVQFASHAKVFDKKRKAVFDWEQFKEVASIFYGFGKKDTHETKEKEQPVEGLEEAADKYAHSLGYNEEKEGLDIASAKDDFIVGADWGRKQVLQEIYDGKVKPVDKITAAWLDDEQNT